MTERQRLQRARMLLVYRAKPCTNATAWRKVSPGTRSSDKSAAEMCRRELVWLRRWLDEHPGVPVPKGDWRQEPKLCIGVTDRPCGEEIPRRQKRCPACAAEQIRLNRRGYKQNYHRSHREPENAKRNERRVRQRQREHDAAVAVEQQKQREAVIAGPYLRHSKYNGRPYFWYPKTGHREWLYYTYGGFGTRPQDRDMDAETLRDMLRRAGLDETKLYDL